MDSYPPRGMAKLWIDFKQYATECAEVIVFGETFNVVLDGLQTRNSVISQKCHQHKNFKTLR